MVKNYNLAVDNFFDKIIKKKKSIKILYISSGSLDKKKYNKNYKNYNLVKKYSEKKFKQLSNLVTGHLLLDVIRLLANGFL